MPIDTSTLAGMPTASPTGGADMMSQSVTARTALLQQLATALAECLHINVLSTTRNSVRKNVLPIGRVVDRSAHIETIRDVLISETADFFSNGYLRTSSFRE